MAYTEYEDIPENNQIFIFGVKHIRTDKFDKYILIGCESDEVYEIDKLFKLWLKKTMNQEIERGNFGITGLLFMVLVKKQLF